MKTPFCALMLILSASCTGADGEPLTVNHTLDPSKPQLVNFSVGMTMQEVKKLAPDAKWSQLTAEGDTYTQVEVEVLPGITITGVFDQLDMLYSLSSQSTEFHLPSMGQVIGATLEILQRRFPDGRLVRGYADGKFANFITGTHLILRFNPDDLPCECFDSVTDCTTPKDLAVEEIYVTGFTPD